MPASEKDILRAVEAEAKALFAEAGVDGKAWLKEIGPQIVKYVALAQADPASPSAARVLRHLNAQAKAAAGLIAIKAENRALAFVTRIISTVIEKI